MATHSSILAWKTAGTEELAGNSPWGHKESDTTEHMHAAPRSLQVLRADHQGHLGFFCFVLLKSQLSPTARLNYNLQWVSPEIKLNVKKEKRLPADSQA